FFATCLTQDTTQTVFDFDLGVPVNSPLTPINSSWMMQLIDIWFSIHPFFVLISKTLLLHWIYDHVSLPILLSDSIATLDTHARIQSPITAGGKRGTGRVVLNVSDISTAQTLLRLSWHHLRRYQARLATGYIQLAARIINDLRSRLATAPNRGNHTPLKVFMEHDCTYMQACNKSIGVV
ncbi:hypothetical protein N7519_002430, partial [Penicillium mononematosum]|uniref:uncharacterized protein n=1 Tax=Penicillium mononematosum TaxID=268346 RepID=UPI0025482023